MISTKKRTIEEVTKEFEDRGYELLEEVYQNNKTKMRYICPKHPHIVQKIRYNDLQQGHGCAECNREDTAKRFKTLASDQKFTEEEVQRELNGFGYDLVEGGYLNAKTPLKYRCKVHPDEIQLSRLSDIRKGHGCRFCRLDRLLPLQEAKDIAETLGYYFKGVEREGRYVFVLYECLKHPGTLLKTHFYDFKRGRACPECGLEKIRGENHYNYDPTKTEEERRIDRRLDQKEKLWRKDVYERDRYMCVVCGKSGELNAHHKDGYNWCLERRYDINNGVTLCNSCHTDFHREYGYGNNTEDQYCEWLTTREVLK